MAGFTRIADAALDHTAVSSQVTASGTPAIGDVVFAGGVTNNGSTATLTGGGMTWSKVDTEANGSDLFLCAFVAVSGTPSAGELTLAVSSGTFLDMAYQWIRPSADIDYASVVGSNNGNAIGDLTVTLTTSGSPSALLAACISQTAAVWTDDAGWTELWEEGNASGGDMQTQQKFADDTEVIFDVGGTRRLCAIALEFGASGPTFTGDVTDGADFGDAASAVTGGRYVTVTNFNDIQ